MSFFESVDPIHRRKEKNRARELRRSQWWKQKLAMGLCHYCEQSFSSEELTMDHVVPIARGGRSTKGNTVTACKECNSQKSYYTPVELILLSTDAPQD
jgi:5-methylcytosine-specific restriction endonuclease McrA